MKKITAILTVSHESERWSEVCQATVPERWVGTTPHICFSDNSSLAGAEYPIIGNTRKDVIKSAIAVLVDRGFHGTLIVRGDKQ